MTTRPFPCARCGGTAEHTPTTFDADRQPTWWTPGFFGQEKVNWSPIALGLGTLILATILERKHT